MDAFVNVWKQVRIRSDERLPLLGITKHMASVLRRRIEPYEAHNGEAGSRDENNDIPRPPATSTDAILEDPGSKIWIPYLDLASKYDNDLVHNWRDDMDSLLIFAALFSASVTAFVIESYNSLVQDTGEVTISVLLQISQQIANGTHSPAAVRPSFQPASIDVAVNTLWFLSLAFSLTCALAAVLVRQWARQYLRFPRSFSSTSEQARARQYVFENMEWWKMDVVVEAIPALLHISLILFFVGLLLFVRAVNFTLAAYLLCFSAIGGTAYTLLTITPLIFSDCPYKTPFTAFSGLCGTSLFRSMLWLRLLQPTWRLFTRILAYLEVFVLSPLIRLWLPSFGFPGRKSAKELSEPVRSTIYLFGKRLRGIQASFKNIYSHRRNVHSFVTSQWSSALYALQRAFKRLSVALRKHRHAFHDQLTIRDAHALQWTLEYSKRDAELFTVVSNVPAFVQYYDSSPEVCAIMWQTGVMSHASRILRSCSIDGSPEIQSVLNSCLESIICLVPCSTYAIQGDHHTLQFGSLSVADLIKDLLPEMYRMQDNLAPVLHGAVSNLVLRQMYALEALCRDDGDEGFWQQYRARQSSMRVTVGLLQVWIWNADSAAAFKSMESQLWTLWELFATEPSSPDELYNQLENFRSAWVTLWINSCPSLSPLSCNGLLLNNLCDAVTHLQEFPHATRDSQRAVFTLLDGLFRTLQRKEFWSLPSNRHPVALACLRVLFGQVQKETAFFNRYGMIYYFLERVHVFGSEGCQFPASGGTVEIPFDMYTKMFNGLLLSIQHGKVDTMGIRQRRDCILNAAAEAIQDIISCRLDQFDSYEKINNILIDSQHLTTLRAARNRGPLDWIWALFSKVVKQTAKEFGYSFQLEDSYNIDVHAELLYYDLGSEPLRIEDTVHFGVEER